MSAPIRKVAPNSFVTGPLEGAIGKAEAAINAADSKPIQDTLGVFGTVISSTAPKALGRASSARAQIRRQEGIG